MSNGKGFKVLTILTLLVAIGGLFLPRGGQPFAPLVYGTTKVYLTSGGDKMVVASGGELEILSGATADYQEGATYTLPAADKVLLDGDTTNQTQTAGALDVNVGAVTANVSGINVAVTTDSGTASGTDVFGGVMTLTQNDADADAFGWQITAAATTNAGANSYEYGILYDCVENTAGACIDGFLLTASTDTGMTDGFDASDPEIVNAVNVGSNLILGGNSDYFTIGATDASFIVTRNDAGSVTFAGADNSTPAETIYDTTGAGTVVVGSADVTAITLTTDGTGTGEVVLPAGSVATAEIADDTITFANISDSSAVDADTTFTAGDGIELALTPSHTTGDTEGMLIDINQVDDAVNTDDLIAFKTEATSESGDANDTIRGIVVNYENGTANTIIDAAIAIDNLETTAGTMTDAVIVTSSGVASGVTDAIDVSAANILNAINIGDNDVVVGTMFGLKNSSTGSVILNFHDYADTTDDDMAHAVLTANCTDTGTAAEDCDFTIGVIEGGASLDTRFNIDADAGMTLGSVANSQIILTAGATVATFTGPPDANASGDLVDMTATNLGGNGNEAFVGLDMNLTNTAGTNANTTRGIELALTSPQADQTESAVYIADNWDADVNASTNLMFAVDDTVVMTCMDPQAAGTGGDIWDLTATFGIMNGSDTSLGLDINLTGANATGTTNLLYGIDIDLTTADPQVTEKALDLNDSDWDYAIDAGAVPIVSTAATFMDDFWGGTVQTWWTAVSGTDAQAVQAIQANAQYGEYQITSGDTGVNCAGDCEGIVLGTHWRAGQGSLIFETRLHIDTAVANEIIFAGFSDTVALEMPGTIDGADALAAVADDFCGFLYDDTAATDQWFAVCFDNTTGATGNGATGVAPVAATYQVLRVEVDAGGEDARFYINGILVKTITANAITITDPLTPMIIVDTNAVESNVVDVDYVFVSAQRG